MTNTEFLQNGITMEQSPTLFRLSTDAMLLADFTRLPPDGRVCDLCAGGGAVGLLLLSRAPKCSVTAVELQAEACALAQKNLEANGLRERMRVVCGDLRQIRTLLQAASFSCVCCNPPYFPVGAGKRPENEALACARTEAACTLPDVCAAAAWLLKTGGSFYLIHRPERLCDVLTALRQAGLEPKLLRFVRHSPRTDWSLVLVRAAAGGKPGLSYAPELLLHSEDGRPTEEYRRIYHTEDEP